ncbi:polyprenyl diphosphate synthase [Kitasatospora sp. NPDC059327]|uniref:polyprenyl diphosphate synthase n=1 Tax=Kitasatospora sp. NPDC059327 TaxID=3346803 RepID=UPI00369DEB1B
MRLLPRRPAPPPPRHVGLILDGNRRWARRRGLRRVTDGHHVGFARTPEVLTWCEHAGVHHVTLWMLSTENLNRDAAEITEVMDVLCATVRRLAFQDRWTIRHLGTTDGLSAGVRAMLELAERETATGERTMTVDLAIGYGGRREITDAVRTVLTHAVRDHGLSPRQAVADLTPEQITEHITADHPPPDLIIRTSGELRSSGFLLWSGTDAHWWTTPTLWPDFRRRDLHHALTHYRKAQRR